MSLPKSSFQKDTKLVSKQDISRQAMKTPNLSFIFRKIVNKWRSEDHIHISGNTLIVGNEEYVGEVNEFIEIWDETIRYVNAYRWVDTRTLIMKIESSIAVTDEIFNKLGLGLTRYFNKTQNLELSFGNCPDPSDEDFILLISRIGRYLKELRSLKLHSYCSYSITDDGLVGIGYEINHNLMNLQSLDLLFHNSLYVHDEGIIDLVTKVTSGLKKLSSLSLGFSGCDRISDEGIAVLASLILPRLSNLKNLSLTFWGSVNITDECLISLSLQMKIHGFKLQKLILDFASCNLVTDTGLEGLTSCLIGLINLKSLAFDFDYLDNITDNGVDTMGLKITQSLAKLQKIKLGFYGCQNVSNKCKENLKETLKEIKNVHIM